jgi:hypothetical protein
MEQGHRREAYDVLQDAYRLRHRWVFFKLRQLRPAEIERGVREGLELLRPEIAPGDRRQEAAASELRKKVGRNDPCVCNSGKKFKKCCGRS